ncbi:MAG: hypothetical protein A7316_10870 [Candidatus Altiarchaeales archaeon WOR_SM1_86-2]|nr:MAG: hypothetical protein A7316_10870 [Candidatus Altiarchaeales archaeon WOR_SM1_86-2]
MEAINNLMLKVEEINKSIIPIIKLSAKIRKQLLDLILEKLIILPDFPREEEKLGGKKISHYENFYEFIKNLNFYFYINIKSTGENFQKYLERFATESLSVFSSSEIRSVGDYITSVSEIYEKPEVPESKPIPEYIPAISQMHEKIEEISTTIPEFIVSEVTRISEISELYEKPETKEEIPAPEYKATTIAYTAPHIPAISQMYEKIEEISTTVPEFVVSQATTIPEIYEKLGVPESKPITEYIPAISQLYEKIEEISTTVPEFIVNGVSRISEISKLYEKPEVQEVQERISVLEHKVTPEYMPAISQLHEKIEEISTTVPEFVVSQVTSISEAYKIPEVPEPKVIQEYIPAISKMHEEIEEITTTVPEFIVNEVSRISEISGIYEKPEVPESKAATPAHMPAISQMHEKIEEISTTVPEFTVNQVTSVSEVYEKPEVPESKVRPEYIPAISQTISNIKETFEELGIMNVDYLTTISEMYGIAESPVMPITETARGLSYATNIPEIYEKIEVLSHTNEYSREIIEKTASAIIDRSMLSSVYEHDKEVRFLDALASFETTKIDQIFPLISALTPQASHSTTVNKAMHNTFNITITTKSISEERDLRELGKKIGMILAEEVRRSGGI